MKETYYILVLIIAINSSIRGQGTNSERIISKDTTINAGIDSLKSNLIVNENVTLTILPGATLYFKLATCTGCSYKIIVKGNIIAKGTTASPIVFTSENPISLSGFMGISIEKPAASSDTAFFDHCIFEYSHLGSDGALYVNAFSKVKITNSIIRNSDGYGIYNEGFVSVDNSSIYSNSGGIYNKGKAKVLNSTLYNNYGGGIYNKGDLLVLNSTIYNNKSKDGNKGKNGSLGHCDCGFSIPSTPGSKGGDGGNGGGIYNDSIAEVISSTITRNTSGNYGPGGSGGPFGTRNITCWDPVTMYREDICYFQPGKTGSNGNIGKGGGIFNTGIINLKNSVVAYNKRADNSNDDISGTINTSSYNIISNKSNIIFTNDSIGNLFINPLVDTLKHNGGITPTCALLSGSPAINALAQGLTDVPVLDQRGFIRLDNPDIGSYEYGAVKYKQNIIETICQGSGFMNHTVTGIYNDYLKTFDGYDSLVILNLTVNEVPVTPIITLNSRILQSNATNGNQWYFSDSIILNATNSTYTPSQTGDYYVIVTLSGCSSQQSNTITLKGINFIVDDNSVRIYPNPTSGVIKIFLSNEFDSDYMVEVYDYAGRLKHVLKKKKSVIDFDIDLDKYPAGLYIVRIFTAGRNYQTRLIKR